MALTTAFDKDTKAFNGIVLSEILAIPGFEFKSQQIH